MIHITVVDLTCQSHDTHNRSRPHQIIVGLKQFIVSIVCVLNDLPYLSSTLEFYNIQQLSQASNIREDNNNYRQRRLSYP